VILHQQTAVAPDILPAVRIIHTSDLHIGASLDERGQTLEQTVLNAVVDSVTAARSDVLLVAGDFFDNNRVSGATVDMTNAVLERLPPWASLVVLPGNHDSYGPDSVYRRYRIGPPSRTVILDDPAGRCVLFAKHRLRLWGRPTITHSESFRPLSGAPARQPDQWNVVVAHGHFTGEASQCNPPRSSPISATELRDANADYIALGHWDQRTDVSSGGAAAWYSGAPFHGWQLTAVQDVLLGPGRQVRVTVWPLGGPSETAIGGGRRDQTEQRRSPAARKVTDL
jgi:DNA repair exonuclease SbcCD nuclease subunit